MMLKYFVPALAAGIFGGKSLGLGFWPLLLLLFCLPALAWARTRKRITIIILAFCLGAVLYAQAETAVVYADDYYGVRRDYDIEISRMMVAAEADSIWEAIIISPLELAGTILTVRGAFDYGLYRVEGVLLPPVRYRNPGQRWWYDQSIYARKIGTLAQPQILSQTSTPVKLLRGLRDGYANNLCAVMDADAAALALAVTTGESKLFDPQIRTSIRQTGVGHITALSGMHIGILAAGALLLFKALRLPRLGAEFLTLILIVCYVTFVGPRLSLLRATLMTGYSLFAFVLSGRSSHSLTVLLWIALAMLCFNPLWLFDAGFILSFGATWCCLYWGMESARWFRFLPTPLARALGLSLAVQVGLLPLNALLFGGISLLAVLVNTLILPLLPIMFTLAVMIGLAGYIFPPLAIVLASLANPLFNGVIAIIAGADTVSAWLRIPVSTAIALACAYAVFLFVRSSWRGRKFVLAGSVLVIILQLTGLAQSVPSIWVMDVGQGDAVLVRAGPSEWYLIDCGDEYAARYGLVPALQYLGATKLKALIITHPHADHAGGMEYVLSQIETQRLYVNMDFSKSIWATDSAVNATTVTHGGLALNRDFILLNYPHPATINDGSLVASINLNQTKVLLAGDIEAQAESYFSSVLEQHQILKVPHHGSATSSDQKLLQALQPRTAIVSCGLGNKFGFPHSQVLEAYSQNEVTLYRTDRDGFVRIDLLPGGTWEVTTFGGETWPATILSTVKSLFSSSRE